MSYHSVMFRNRDRMVKVMALILALALVLPILAIVFQR